MVETPPRTDEELVKALQEKDESAFTEMYLLYSPTIRRAIYRLCPQDDIEDVIQAVFLRVYERIYQFNGESKFSTWLRHIAINHTRDLYRRKQTRGADKCVSTDTVYDPSVGSWVPGVDVGADDPRMRYIGDLDRLSRLIDTLPVRMQEVLRARLSGEQMITIANKQGRKPSSVRSDYNRAILQLREMMGE